MMADAGPRLLAVSHPSPPNSRSPHYTHSPLSSDSAFGRRKFSIPSLSSPYNQIAPNMAASSIAAPNIKAEFGGVGTGILYGGPQPPTTIPAPPHPNDQNDTLNLNLLKPFGDKRLTRDGQPAKRRGPKPDSKPALTRRQELNRQAQRTHRERKELYIKALEDEVLRLKEIYSNVSQDKDRLAEENRSLKLLLHQNGLAVSGPSAMRDESLSSPSVGPYMGTNSSASVTGSASYGLASTSTQNTPYTPPTGSGLSATAAMPRGLSPSNGLSPAQQASGLHRHSPSKQSSGPQRNPIIDYDQSGINFVLTLERPCMDHMPWLLERSSANGGLQPCGHALMASCPPEPFPDLTADIPFGHQHGNNTANNRGHVAAGANQAALSPSDVTMTGMSALTPTGLSTQNAGDNVPRTWELSKADLATLLDLSQKLNLDGEITPVMAWGMVLGHPRLGELNGHDFEKLAEELVGKVRCYGFGAVMEEFEVRDALEAVLSTKPEPLGTYGGGF